MALKPFISIIVPTYHDWDRLSLCIQALDEQTYPKQRYEVIVVNNDPDDNMPLGYYLPANMTIVSEGKPGSYAARNQGISLAKGVIYGFTDSDCIPHPEWIEEAAKVFEAGNVDRIAGKIEFIFKNDEKQTWIELYESIYEFNQKKAVKDHKASVTANLFVRKEVFEKVGLFDLSKMSGEDFGWNRRATAKSFNIVYADKVTISHPARSTFSEFRKKKRREFGGKKSYKITGVMSVVKHFLFLPFYFYLVVVKKNLQLFSVEKRLSVSEIAKVFLLNLYLYLINSIEYFRLMFKGEKLR